MSLCAFLFANVCQAQGLDDAIDHFAQKKKEAYDKRAYSNLRNAATSEEVYFLDHNQYVSCKNEECSHQLPGLLVSDGVEIKMRTIPGGFAGQASHSKGTGKIFYWDSTKGGLQPSK